uniref:ATP synthase subunit d, mitochondrial n=2 Tax=Sus scrofa TaxID=9823 RepID=A0A8D1PSX3_PIG
IEGSQNGWAETSLKATDWIAIANSVKSWNETLASRLAAIPEKPPARAMDWAYYKANAGKAGLVDGFERKCEKLCLVFASPKTRTEESEKKPEKMKNIIPFDQMTIEDLNQVLPETKLDKKYPCWPHGPIESL